MRSLSGPLSLALSLLKAANRIDKRPLTISSSAATSTCEQERPQPLAGIRVLELGQLIAGPFCGQILAHFGADVIKVEPPVQGDPLRVWRELDKEDGVSPWFRSLNRNKRSIELDLRKENGREIAKKLAVQSDVVIENFKAGTVEKWGLGPEDLYKEKPDLVFTRISGWGQTGPMSGDGGFAAVCEGFGGLRYVNGFPDENGKLAGAPVRPNLSIGDSLAGTNAALGTVLALLARGKLDPSKGRTGQTVDVAIYESVLNMMEGLVPNYDRTGAIRGPSGAGVTGIVPTTAFPTKIPSAYVIIGGNNDSIYVRLMEKIGRGDLTGPGYANNKDRAQRQAEIEGAIEAWTRQHTVEEVLEAMKEAKVPSGPINSVKDIVEDKHVQARGMIEEVPVRSKRVDKEWTVKMPGLSPVLEFGGKTRWAGPDLGEHTSEVLRELEISPSELKTLKETGVIG